jgi:hypothetical protein
MFAAVGRPRLREDHLCRALRAIHSVMRPLRLSRLLFGGNVSAATFRPVFKNYSIVEIVIVRFTYPNPTAGQLGF